MHLKRLFLTPSLVSFSILLVVRRESGFKGGGGVKWNQGEEKKQISGLKKGQTSVSILLIKLHFKFHAPEMLCLSTLHLIRSHLNSILLI